MEKGLHYKYEFFSQMVISDFKRLYKNSILGMAWLVLKPFLQFLLFFFIFTFIVSFKKDNYAVFLLIGIIIWNFIAEGCTRGMYSLYEKAHIVKKIKVPYELIVAAACMNAFLILCFNFLFLFLFLFLFGFPIGFYAIFVFFILPFLFLFVLGISFALSVIFVHLPDVRSIWELLLQILFWFSPIVYPASLLPSGISFFMIFNPIAGYVGSAQTFILSNSLPAFSSMGLTLLMTGFIFIIGYYIFKKKELYFVEEL